MDSGPVANRVANVRHGSHASCYRRARMRGVSLRLLLGPTLFLAIMYAPLVAYPFWAHFYNYSGPRWALLLPIPLPIIAGLIDHKLSAFQCAVLLTGAAYAMAIADAIRESVFGASPWSDAIATPVFAAIWFATAIFLPTMVLVMVGRALYGLFRPRRM